MVGENMADTDTSTAGSNSDEVILIRPEYLSLMLPMSGQGGGRVLAGEVREPRGDRGGGRGGGGRGRGELRGDPQLHPAAAGGQQCAA